MNQDEAIALLARTVSEFAGRLSAFDATLRGLLLLVSEQPGVAEAVGAELEREYASHLHTSQNSVFMQEFEAQADSIKAMIGAAIKK
jgi:hypothetical protein